ncbi:cation transporter [bacterium]|nr:cation transporter [bacterium]
MTPMAHHHEKKLMVAVAINSVMMGFEIIFGWWTGSMALLADGWHMATHVGALLISWAAYWMVRRWTHDRRLTQGSSDILPLAGYTNAIILVIVGLVTMWASFGKYLDPSPIHFDTAIWVASIGLVVNAVSAMVLKVDDSHDEQADHNIQSAYMHVLTDAFTSILAIVGLVAGKVWGLTMVDPLVGFVGGVMIVRWGVGMATGAAKTLIHFKQ